MSNKVHSIKKIGVYDSGLGGLFLLSYLWKAFPNYEYVFLGDEKNLPYGSKPIPELLTIAKKNIEYLFEKENCDVVVIACNTLSATVYPLIVDEYTKNYPDKMLVDIISPTIDTLAEDSVFSVFGTERTISSHVYREGIHTRFPESIVHEYQTSELATLIEENKNTEIYLSSFKKDIHPDDHTCIFACTHYGIIHDSFEKVFPQFGPIICQHTILVDYMKFFLHIEPGASLGKCTLYVTQENPVFTKYAKEWFSGLEPQVLIV